MKRILPLLLASSFVHAGCGELEIKIINNSTHNCTFKNKVMYFGTLPTESVPTILLANQSTPFFNATQDNTGIGVLLTYTCDNELVKFYSWQQYCSFFGAGEVGGQPMDSSTLNLDYETTQGSFLGGRPGQITWRIS